MTKIERHELIKSLLRRTDQPQNYFALMSALTKAGVNVSHSTLARDLKALGVVLPTTYCRGEAP